MKKMLAYAALCLFTCSLLSACSDKKEEDASKGPIKKMTERTAQGIVQKIQTPIDRAREANET